MQSSLQVEESQIRELEKIIDAEVSNTKKRTATESIEEAGLLDAFGISVKEKIRSCCTISSENLESEYKKLVSDVLSVGEELDNVKNRLHIKRANIQKLAEKAASLELKAGEIVEKEQIVVPVESSVATFSYKEEQLETIFLKMKEIADKFQSLPIEVKARKTALKETVENVESAVKYDASNNEIEASMNKRLSTSSTMDTTTLIEGYDTPSERVKSLDERFSKALEESEKTPLGLLAAHVKKSKK